MSKKKKKTRYGVVKIIIRTIDSYMSGGQADANAGRGKLMKSLDSIHSVYHLLLLY